MKKLRSLYICCLMCLVAACGEPVQKVPGAVDAQSANLLDSSVIKDVYKEQYKPPTDSADASSPPDSHEWDDADSPTVIRLDAAALAIGDPGIPGSEYGPKMRAQVSAPPGTPLKMVFGTAAAVNRPEGCHLFLIPEHVTLSNFPRFYLSVVIPQESWTEGIYRDHLRGRIEVDTHSGHSYKLDLDEALPGQFELAVERVFQSTEVNTAYLTGVLRATVPPQAGTAGDPIELDFDLNVPARRQQISTN